MKDINKLIDTNLNLLFSAENNEMYYNNFLDVNGERTYNDVLSKLFAEELQKKELVKIYESLCILTEKGKLIVNEGGWYKYLEKQKQFEKRIEEKENLEFEKSKVDLSLNKWLLKTKWIPHILAIISLLMSLYFYFDSKKDTEELQKKIEEMNSKIRKVEAIKK
jgi:outer membrane protein OmpA-like peptidoglycan-associated protein